jgi:hypothetical protein
MYRQALSFESHRRERLRSQQSTIGRSWVLRTYSMNIPTFYGQTSTLLKEYKYEHKVASGLWRMSLEILFGSNSGLELCVQKIFEFIRTLWILLKHLWRNIYEVATFWPALEADGLMRSGFWEAMVDRSAAIFDIYQGDRDGFANLIRSWYYDSDRDLNSLPTCPNLVTFFAFPCHKSAQKEWNRVMTFWFKCNKSVRMRGSSSLSGADNPDLFASRGQNRDRGSKEQREWLTTCGAIWQHSKISSIDSDGLLGVHQNRQLIQTRKLSKNTFLALSRNRSVSFWDIASIRSPNLWITIATICGMMCFFPNHDELLILSSDNTAFATS